MFVGTLIYIPTTVHQTANVFNVVFTDICVGSKSTHNVHAHSFCVYTKKSTNKFIFHEDLEHKQMSIKTSSHISSI